MLACADTGVRGLIQRAVVCVGGRALVGVLLSDVQAWLALTRRRCPRAQVVAFIELQEGKTAMARRPYAAKDRNGVSYPKTTASVLRLIEPYRHCFPLPRGLILREHGHGSCRDGVWLPLLW